MIWCVSWRSKQRFKSDCGTKLIPSRYISAILLLSFELLYLSDGYHARGWFISSFCQFWTICICWHLPDCNDRQSGSQSFHSLCPLPSELRFFISLKKQIQKSHLLASSLRWQQCPQICRQLPLLTMPPPLRCPLLRFPRPLVEATARLRLPGPSSRRPMDWDAADWPTGPGKREAENGCLDRLRCKIRKLEPPL
jgi:hypothetical protein